MGKYQTVYQYEVFLIYYYYYQVFLIPHASSVAFVCCWEELCVLQACVSVDSASFVCSVCLTDRDKGLCSVCVAGPVSVARACAVYQRPVCVPSTCHCVVHQIYLAHHRLTFSVITLSHSPLKTIKFSLIRNAKKVSAMKF